MKLFNRRRRHLFQNQKMEQKLKRIFCIPLDFLYSFDVLGWVVLKLIDMVILDDKIRAYVWRKWIVEIARMLKLCFIIYTGLIYAVYKSHGQNIARVCQGKLEQGNLKRLSYKAITSRGYLNNLLHQWNFRRTD